MRAAGPWADSFALDLNLPQVQRFQVRNMPATAAVMTAVESQPIIRSVRETRVNWPMTFLFWHISIITTMIGTAATPLITAAQNNALIGVRWVTRCTAGKFIASPTRVAAARTP